MSNSADRMIGHLRQQVNDLKNLEQEAGDACRKLQKTISELMEGVQKATHGSEVGSKQCIIALQSALSKCYTAANLLSTSTRPWSFPPFTDGAKVMMSGKGTYNKGDIVVTPEIRRVQRELEDRAEEVNKILKSMETLQQKGFGGTAVDLWTFGIKYMLMRLSLISVVVGMTNYAGFLGYAYDRYHNEQEDAIARAMSIPK